MSKPKLLIWLGRPEETFFRREDLERLRTVAEITMIEVAGQRYSEEETIRATGDSELIITTWTAPQYTEQVLKQCPNLRFYGRVGGSLNKAIDPSAWDLGVKVVTSVDAQGLLLADLTLSLMLSGLHRFSYYTRMQWGGGPLDKVIDHVRVPQRTLIEKRVGLLGFGAIAKHVTELLKPFRCQIHAYDPFMPDEVFERYGVFRADSIERLCEQVEVLSIHAAYREETRGLLSREAIGKLPVGSLVVNTSYGELIDTEALKDRLRDREIFACLDMVAGGMPGPLDSLRYYPNCQVTPSISAYSDGVLHMGRQVIDEAIRYISGQPLKHEVSKESLAFRA
jgi:phosphoglycerate dehydrogenase-like enzyme